MNNLIAQRNTVILVFIAFGAAAGSQFGALPFLVQKHAIPPFVFGLMGSAGILSGIVAWGIGGYLAHKVENRQILLAALPITFAVLTLLLLAPSFGLFVVLFCLFSFMLGVTDLFMNAEGAVVEHDLATPVFSRYHGAASLAIAFFAIIGSIVSVNLSPVATVIPAAAPFIAAWISVWRHMPHRAVPVGHAPAVKPKLPIKLLATLGFAAGFGVSCEMAALQWAGQLLTAIAPQLAAFSGLGVAFYGLCSGLMRLLGDWLRARFGELQALVSCLSIGICGFGILAFAPGFWISTFAFALVGVGFAISFPTLMSFAARAVPQARAAAMGYVSTISGVPRTLAPWIFGWLASAYSLGAVFAASAMIAVIALLLVILAFGGAQNTSGQHR